MLTSIFEADGTTCYRRIELPWACQDFGPRLEVHPSRSDCLSAVSAQCPRPLFFAPIPFSFAPWRHIAKDNFFHSFFIYVHPFFTLHGAHARGFSDTRSPLPTTTVVVSSSGNAVKVCYTIRQSRGHSRVKEGTDGQRKLTHGVLRSECRPFARFRP